MRRAWRRWRYQPRAGGVSSSYAGWGSFRTSRHHELSLAFGHHGQHDLRLIEIRGGHALDVGRGHFLVAREILLDEVRRACRVIVRGQLVGFAEHRCELVEERRAAAVERARELARGHAFAHDLADLLRYERRHAAGSLAGLWGDGDLEVAISAQARLPRVDVLRHLHVEDEALVEA